MGILLDRYQRILHRTKHRSRWRRINPLPLRLARILTLRPKLGQNLVSRTIACDYLNREESINVAELLDKLGSVKELAHDIAENYTWD